jgi:molybdopterin-guanine dinucleotide biosynthesis protein A
MESNMRSPGKLSTAILAGGESSRMGTDKAFMSHKGVPFISVIASEASKVSEDVVVIIGRKRMQDFEAVLSSKVRVFNDDSYIANPLGGILSAFRHVKNRHVAIVTCDAPLAKASVISYLFNAIQNHSAVVPIWKEEDKMTMEPLFAVYDIAKTKEALFQTLNEGSAGPKVMILRLQDVLYVSMTQLRLVDPLLDSFVNINTEDDYSAMEGKNIQKVAHPDSSDEKT